MARMHNLHLMTPQVIWCIWLWYTASFSHLCGKILKICIFKLLFSTLHLDLLGITSPRKLAHIQRCVLLNCHFNSITDIPVGTCLLVNMRPVSTTGPKVILIIFIFFQNTVVSTQLGKIPILGSRTKIYTIQLIHGCERQFGMLNCIATVAKSNQIHVFLLSR